MFGETFSNVWSTAKIAAKEAVAKIVDESIEKVDRIATRIKNKATAITEKVHQKALQVEKVIDEKVVEIKQKVQQIYDTVKKKVISIAQKAKKAFLKAVKIFSIIAKFVIVTCPLAIGNFIEGEIVGNSVEKGLDGKFLTNCIQCSPNIRRDIDTSNCLASKGSTTKPILGKKPTNENCDGEKPRIYFINGIENSPQDNCKTSRELAKVTCSEVVGIYNRTEGLVRDGVEAIRNIFGSHPFGGNKPTNTTTQLILEAILQNPPKEITLYAHSQGGLILRESLNEVKNRLRRKPMGEKAINDLMQKINIKSFGTAEDYWPDGPNYEQYSNPNDKVPFLIAQADKIKNKMMASRPSDYSHTIEKTPIVAKSWNPLSSHKMIESYLPELKKQRILNQMNGKEFKCAKCTC